MVKALAEDAASRGVGPWHEVPMGTATQDVVQEAVQDLSWLHSLLRRHQPFTAVVHCLCTPDP